MFATTTTRMHKYCNCKSMWIYMGCLHGLSTWVVQLCYVYCKADSVYKGEAATMSSYNCNH